MRESESFDAFYARTVSVVTSKVHALADGDPQADHAIREAYARAYQQWYEVSGYRDTEGWVLDVAKEAYERRRSQPESARYSAPVPDTGTWPGMYRERAPGPQQPGDPDATARGGNARPGGPVQAGAGPYGSGGPGGSGGSAAAGPAPASPVWGDPYPAGPVQAHADQPGSTRTSAAGHAYGAGPGQAYGAGVSPGADAGLGTVIAGAGAAPLTADMPGNSSSAGTAAGRLGWPPQAGGSKPVIAVVAAIVILAAAAGYLAFGRGHTSPSANPKPTARVAASKPKAHMLPAGQVGTRAAVPWSLVGPGWTLAELSTGQSGSSGQPTGGTSTTVLVDPVGGRYLMYQWPAGASPTLLAWSGDAYSALYETASGYSVLALRTGQPAPLGLPAGVAVAGFTRPDGLNILAVRQGPVLNKLQRYDLTGAYQATLASMPRRPAEGALQGSCASASCGALSSPDGTTAVWAVRGDEMQLVGNAGGLIRRLHVPDSGSPPTCTPVSWWNSATVLANCDAVGAQYTDSRLWLVPVNGSAPSPLAVASGGPSGDGYLTGAWQAGGQVYATSTSSSQCAGAPSGPGGLGIMRLSQAGSPSPVLVSGSTNNYSAVMGSAGDRLLVLAQTSCPGSSSLLWLNPSTGGTQMLVTATASEAGVTSAVAFGSASTAPAG